jgi:hypothetical protein
MPKQRVIAGNFHRGSDEAPTLGKPLAQSRPLAGTKRGDLRWSVSLPLILRRQSTKTKPGELRPQKDFWFFLSTEKEQNNRFWADTRVRPYGASPMSAKLLLFTIKFQDDLYDTPRRLRRHPSL